MMSLSTDTNGRRTKWEIKMNIRQTITVDPSVALDRLALAEIRVHTAKADAERAMAAMAAMAAMTSRL